MRNPGAAFIQKIGGSGLGYAVPEHANNVRYMLGGMTLFCILTAVFSGLLLAQFYNPDPLYAHASIVFLTNSVFLGDFIRSVHYWSANLAMILIIFHAVRVFVYGSYKRPRQVTWLTGIGLLAVMIGLFFSGTILKWDQEAFEALDHSDAAMRFLGPLGYFFSSGADISVSFLTRLYVAHVSIFVMLLFGLLLAHFYLIKKHGISPKVTVGALSVSTRGQGGSNFLAHLKKLTGFGFLTVSLIATLALLSPAPLGQPGVTGAEVTKPPWIFLPLFALENFFGITALLWVPAVVLALLVALPFIDRGDWIAPRQRKVIVTAGALFIAAMLALGYYAWKSPIKTHIGSNNISGYAAWRQLKEVFLPTAYADGMQMVYSSPTNVMLGERVTIQAEGLEPGGYELVLSGMNQTHYLGLVEVGEEEGFAQEYALPISRPDVFRVELKSPDGHRIYSKNPLVIQAKMYPGSGVASEEQFELDRHKSPSELLLIFSFILLLTFAGALLVL